MFTLNVALSFLLTCVPAAVMVALSAFVMGFSGTFYARHADVLIVLAIAAIPGALNNVLSSAGISLDAVRAWLISDIALAAAFFGAAVGLIPTLGAVGLAWAYLIGYVVTDAVLVLPVKARLRRCAGPRPPVGEVPL